MIDGGKHNPVPYQDTVTDADASLILKTTAGIDENVFSYGNIFSKIGVKWRKQGKRCVNGLSRQSGHQFPYLICGMVRGIQFRRNAHSFMTIFNQQIMCFRSRFYTFAPAEMFNKFMNIHCNSFI